MWSSGSQVVGDPGAEEIRTPQFLSEQLMQTISHTPSGDFGEGISEHGGGLESLPFLTAAQPSLSHVSTQAFPQGEPQQARGAVNSA